MWNKRGFRNIISCVIHCFINCIYYSIESDSLFKFHLTCLYQPPLNCQVGSNSKAYFLDAVSELRERKSYSSQLHPWV